MVAVATEASAEDLAVLVVAVATEASAGDLAVLVVSADYPLEGVDPAMIAFGSTEIRYSEENCRVAFLW